MIRFDTRNKKPHLFGLLALAVIFAAVCAALLLTGGEKSTPAVCALIAVFCLITIVYLLITLRGQIQYNPYSYNTIYYTGFSLFALDCMITYTVLAIAMIRNPAVYTARSLPRYLLYSAKNYMILTSPFIFLFSAALCVSNISLIRHEGKRLVNVLGIILSFLLVAGEIIIFCFDYHSLIHLFAAVYLYFECMLIGVIAAFFIVTGYEAQPDKDFLIILGCGLRKDGSPCPLLRGRIDRALAFYEKQKMLTGKDAVFVTSGGQGKDEVISESASMKRYLMEKGIPEEKIIEEDRSTSTFENMKFSKAKIWPVNPNGKIAFFTTNYHVFRSGLFARRVKMRAVGMGAKTKWYFWPNASVREFVGLLTEHKGKQALILGSMIIFYAILTYQVYFFK